MPSAVRTCRRGFTLIEACIVMAIIGIGCVSMLQLLATGTMANADATEMTTAMMLANNIREATANCFFASNHDTSGNVILMDSNDYYETAVWRTNSATAGSSATTWADVDDFDGAGFSPAIDARCNSLSQYSNWSQRVSVQLVDPNRIWSVTSQPAVGATWTPALTPLEQVTVTVTHNGNAVCTVHWLVAYAP